jgi:asparagine synthase (glutamine-hydrolysing)
VSKLPPAHALRFDIDEGRVHQWRYWSVPEAPGHGGRPSRAEDLVTELEQLLSDSVALRLVADVPVGILLSGGVDSSLVTACAAARMTRVKTFTIAFPGHEAYDEAMHARKVAAHFGADHHELEADAATVDMLPALARICDEPIADSSVIPTYLVSRLTRQHVTVALGGDGGDELFGGYTHYDRLLRREARVRHVPTPIRRSVARAAAGCLPIGFRGRHYLASLGSTFAHGAVDDATVFDRVARQGLLSREVRAVLGGNTSPEAARLEQWSPTGEPVYRMSRLDFETYLPDDILVKVDRASMAVSLELRAPWLDRHLIEFAFGTVPDHLKNDGTHRKVLPKLLAARLLPKTFDLERKQGFSIPLVSWFKDEWGPALDDILLSMDASLVEPRAVRSLLEGQRHGRSNTTRLFALALFELWRREYGVAVR